MRRIFYLFAPCIIFCFYSITSTAQSLAGNYTVTGYFFHPTLPRTENLVKSLTQINDSTYEANLGDLDNSYNYYFRFTVNAANQLVNWQPVGSTPADTTSGFMTADNPGGFSYYPDTTHGYTSDIYNNTYDPVTQTFYMHYGYNNTGGINSDTGQASYTRQIYEKWVYQQVPVYNHSDIHSGGPGTVVTLFGKYFTGATNVYFGGREASSFMVQSDSVITAVVGGGNYGAITIASINGISLSKDDFVFIPPVITDTLWTALGKAGFSAGAANYVSMALNTAGLPYVAYQDKTNGNKAMVMKLGDNNTWLPVGGYASAGASSYTNIAIGTDDIPYIAYLDSANQNGITVRKFSGESWQDVGSPNIDSFTQNSPKVALVLDSNNLPYVLGSHKSDFNTSLYGFNLNKFDGTSWSKTSPDKEWNIYSKTGNANIAIDTKTSFVYLFSDDGYGMMYDGTYWDTLLLRSTNITSGVSGYPDIAIDSNSAVYIAYPNTPFQQVNIYKYNGHWQQLSGTDSTLNHGRNVSLVLNQSATPYLLYQDYDYNSQGTVAELVDSAGFNSWKTVGARGFAASSYFTQNSIVISKNGIPYIAFSDSKNGNKVTVMHYETYEEFTPRTTDGLYSQGDSATCAPWVKAYPDWTTYNSTDSLGATHIEMQTQFQDVPGNLCGFQSYIDSSSTYRTTEFGPSTVLLSPRNYRIAFSDSNFTHPVGVRLFGLTAEIDTLLAQADRAFSGGRTADQIVIYRYDGPNEDYLPGNNTNGNTVYDDSMHGVHTDYNYTTIHPTIHYYGTHNEYYYLEFTTDHFSEFYSGITLVTLLPVNLLSFSAAVQDEMTSLLWQTSNEVNASFFTVQRSTDGVHFTNLTKVNAAGTDGNHSYSYKDALSGITATKVYYRLLMTDKDGSTRQSSVVSVNLAGTKLITLQPNPARSYAVVTFHAAGKKTVTVTDVNGRKVFTKTTASNSETIGVSTFAKGLYFVRVDYANGYDVQKLVVE